MLPQAPGELAPTEELERALLDHQTLKATTDSLQSRIDAAGLSPGSTGAGSRQTASESRLPVDADDEVRTPPTVQDALVAARRAVAVAKAHAQGSRSLEAETYPVAEVLAMLDQRLEALEPGRGISTEEWFEELPVPEAQATLLLALLELARLQRILIGQRVDFGAVLLKRLS